MEDTVNNYPDTVMALRALAIGGERRLLAAAADEIERLRTQVAQLLPFAVADANLGASLGPLPFDHNCENCEDCRWYNESLLLLRRIESGEFGEWPNAQKA